MDHRLHRKPCKGLVPFGKQQRMPQATNTPISIGKRMDQFQFIVEYTAAEPTTKLLHQALCHNAMSSQQSVYGVGITFIQPFINLIGIPDFVNILGWNKDMLTISDWRKGKRQLIVSPSVLQFPPHSQSFDW